VACTNSGEDVTVELTVAPDQLPEDGTSTAFVDARTTGYTGRVTPTPSSVVWSEANMRAQSFLDSRTMVTKMHISFLLSGPWSPRR
jgi:hypothetical protein